MNLCRPPAVVKPSSLPKQFRRARELSGRTLRDVILPTGIAMPQLCRFELGKYMLIERHRVTLAKFLNEALADHVRELRRIGALGEPSPSSQVEQESIRT